MTLWLILIAAGLGIRHAFAPDHLAAVGTFTEKTEATRRNAVWYALRIAAGHSVGMLLIAGLVVGLLVSLPPLWVRWTTWGSGIWLLVMALWILWDLAQDVWRSRSPYRSELHREAHGKAARWLKNPAAAWLVGLLFGLAVSPGDLAIFTLMVKNHATPWVGFALLAIFLLAMFLGLGVVGGGLGWANTRQTVRRWFQAISGVAGMGVALALVTGYLH